MCIQLFRLWFSAGIQTDSVLSARLQIIRIYIREDGRLVIEFKTHAKFRGQRHRSLKRQAGNGPSARVLAFLTSCC